MTVDRNEDIDAAVGNRLIDLSERIAQHFDASDWHKVGLLSETSTAINGHRRLLRSLDWRDDDYPGNVLEVLYEIVRSRPQALPVIESYVDRTYPGDSEYISPKESQRRITFAPNVFQVPDCRVELDVVAVMMPFAMEFNPAHQAIRRACDQLDLRCLRVDDIWEESAIIQDIFSLIFRAQVIVVDFSGKNANVMYETGIAHTLGKHVIPVTQSMDDVPFDLKHHRVLKYLPNAEGYEKLTAQLKPRLVTLAAAPAKPERPTDDDDDIPF